MIILIVLSNIKLLNLCFYSIALDKSTDMANTAQLAVFVREIIDNFKTTEEFLSLHPIKVTTPVTDLFLSLMKVLDKFNLELTNLAGIATDGCPSMAERNKGVVALMGYHCILHQQILCAKTVSFENLIHLGLNLLTSTDPTTSNIDCFKTNFYVFLLLSRGKMLQRVFELKDTIKVFMKSKEKLVSELNGSHFSNFKKSEKLIDLFSRPFIVIVSDVPGNIQIILTDVQYNCVLKEKFSLGLTEICSKYVYKKCLGVCEQLFSTLNFVENKTRIRLTDVHLENSLKMSTSKIKLDMYKLVKK
ncbi:hypothetical protein PR048_008404, partial [Dryococelus australis]